MRRAGAGETPHERSKEITVTFIPKTGNKLDKN